MKKAEVKFENITKKFNETIAVDNVSCIFEAGTLTTLLGPSGCGKTTSLRIIAGLERATEGKILVDNEDVTILPATDRDVSMVFQSYALFPHMSVIENVSYGLKMINVNKKEYTEKALETLKLVNLDGYENRMPSELSGGQQQRVAIARSLCMEPKILLFDEPTSALDPEMISEVLDVMIGLAETGITMICVTHEMGFARRVADQMVFMDQGTIVEMAPPSKFFDNPSTERCKRFLKQILQH